MLATARFDLKMDTVEKDYLSRTAALQGVTMAAFVRTAAKEKARDKEVQFTMSDRDFHAFTVVLNAAFTPNSTLQNAINSARGRVQTCPGALLISSV